MPMPSPTLDPIKHSNLWHGFTLKGVLSPGFLLKGGTKGFARKTGWDEKKGKGTQGATLTLTDMPPAKGNFTLQLFTPEHFAAWDDFVLHVLSIDPEITKATGLAIYHPSLSSIGVTAVVVSHYTAPEHVGKGMYHVEIHLIEWTKPPPKNITSTPDSTSPDNPDPTKPRVEDPRITELQKRIKAQQDALNKAAQP